MIVFHHNDLDGRCAAAIIGRWKWMDSLCPEITYVEMDYNKAVPADKIGFGEQVVIVDFSFKPEVMDKVFLITPNVIWIDHHATAKSYDYGNKCELAGLRDFSDKGLSGCELTWKYIYPGKPMPQGVALIGDYDAWRLTRNPDCFRFYEGLKLKKDQSPTAKFWDEIFEDSFSFVNSVMIVGETAILYRDAYCEDFIKQFGYETELDGVKMFAVNLFRFGSKCFGERMKQYPACIGYAHDGKQYQVSLYSDTGVDVSVICKAHGGGGHKGASGFQCKELPFIAQRR